MGWREEEWSEQARQGAKWTQNPNKMQVGNQTIELAANDIIIVEPGEVPTFRPSSPDHFHFVIQTPGLTGEAAKLEKVLI